MDPFIGEIRPFPYTFAPVGWLYCDGRLVQISDYQALYLLIGTTYGGDGVTTFGLPDLRGRVPMGAGSGASLGTPGGAEEVTLLSSQLPLHSHPMAASSNGGSDTPVGTHPGYVAKAKAYGTATTTLAGDSIAPSPGGGGSHPNVQPYLTLAFCICYEGIYPSQN